MRSAAETLAYYRQRDDEPEEDQVVFLYDVTWEDYARLGAIKGDHGPRMTYCEGVLEIMSPSQRHEELKSAAGRLVDAYCLDAGIEFTPVGAWTIRKKPEQRGVEPDECYLLGASLQKRTVRRPDLAIEVFWTSGRIDKLDVYRKLGVREVWLWQRGVLEPYGLRGQEYEKLAGSKLLPGLDLALVAEHMAIRPVSAAIRQFRAVLAERAVK
jgi:Uma2 family endonuclease